MARLNNNFGLNFALRDYHHAAKTFTSEPGYEKLPYSGYLFHVNISFNSLTSGTFVDTKNISVLIKAADLPEVRFETETLNQYNRKRIINKKVEYQPIKLTFHDDVANNVRNMWISYNQHYSADSRYVDENTWQLDNVYQNEGISRPHGLDVNASVPFINKIEIFSMGNQNYSKMLLVNPIISSASFDDHAYSDGAKVMQMAATVEYENIIYSTGTTDQIPGFGKENTENYDLNTSSLGDRSLLEIFGLGNTKESRSDTPVSIERILTPSEFQSRQVDSIIGNVSRTATRFVDAEYQQLKRTTVNSFARNQSQFVFPDTSIAQLDSITVGTGISNFDSGIGRSTQISSNGQNISMIRRTPGVSTTPIASADSAVSAEILVSPVVPSALTSAERTLFAKSFPPLPSTDPRAKLPPYTGSSSGIAPTPEQIALRARVDRSGPTYQGPGVISSSGSTGTPGGFIGY